MAPDPRTRRPPRTKPSSGGVAYDPRTRGQRYRAPVPRDHATDVTSGKGRGYGPPRKVTVLDLMAAHRAGNTKYVKQFLPTLSKAAQNTFRRRRSIFDSKRKAADEAAGKQINDSSGPRFNGTGKSRPRGHGHSHGGGGRSGGGNASRSSVGSGLGSWNQLPLSGSMGVPEALLMRGFTPLGDGFADKLAGLEFDESINEALRAVRRQPAEEAQNLRNIRDWGQQVVDAQGKSAAANKALHAALSASQGGTSQAIIEALGGEAAPGAGMVGAAAAQNAGTLAALSASDESYQSNIRPLLEAANADRLSNEQAVQRNQAQDLAAKVSDLRRARGQTRSKNLFAIQQYNNELGQARGDAILKARGFNNSLLQQDFQNRMGAAQLDLAAQMNQAKMFDIFRGSKNAKPTGWAALDAAAKATLSSDASVQVKDPETGQVRPEFLRPDGSANIPAIVARVTDTYRSWGLAPRGNSQVRAHVFATLRGLGIQPDSSWLPPTKKKKRR